MSELRNSIQSLSKKKKYKKIVKLTESLGQTEADLELHFARGEALYRLGYHDDALTCFQVCITHDISNIFGKRRFLNAARYVKRIIGNDEQANSKFWAGCVDHRSTVFERASDEFLSGNYNEAADIFSGAVIELFGESKTAENWIRSFSDLIAIDRDSATFPETKIPSVCKIFLCGMGWSGSSALRDYFREFPYVLLKRGEYQYIEDDISLLDVHAAIRNQKDWKRTFLTFFLGGVLGFARVISYTGYKHIYTARQSSLAAEGGALKLSEAMITVIQSAAGFFNADNDKREQAFLSFARDFVNLVSSGAYLEDAEYFILDNAVHIRTLDSVGFIDNAYFFPTFRDPRSMQVSRQIENRTYVRGGLSYINSFRNKVIQAQHKISVLSERVENENVQCIPVQFERFVMDEGYREGLAQDMGLNLNAQKKYTTFKPWQSARNVFIHETHGDANEISLIEKELPEYCADLESYRDELARLEAISQNHTELASTI